MLVLHNLVQAFALSLFHKYKSRLSWASHFARNYNSDTSKWNLHLSLFLHFQLNYIQVNFNQLLILVAALNLIFYAYIVGIGFETDTFIASDDRLETAKSPNSSDKVNEALRNEDKY